MRGRHVSARPVKQFELFERVSEGHVQVRNASLFLSLILVASSVSAQLDRALSGRWISREKEMLEISPTVIRYRSQVCDEGRCQLKNPYLCKWSPTRDQLRDSMGGGTCQFSESTRGKSKDVILREFNARRREETNTDKGFVAYIKRARGSLESMKPVPLRNFILNDAGDVYEFYFDGDRIFRITPLGVGVETFTRSR